jgi:hypothetical protein
MAPELELLNRIERLEARVRKMETIPEHPLMRPNILETIRLLQKLPNDPAPFPLPAAIDDESDSA